MEEALENVSLAVWYAPVLHHLTRTCSLTYIALLSEFNLFHCTLFSYKLTKMYWIIYQWRSQRGGTGDPGPPRNAHQKKQRGLVDWTLSPERWFSPIHRRIRPSGLRLQDAGCRLHQLDIAAVAHLRPQSARVTTAVCTAVTGHQPGDWPAFAWCRVNCVGAATAQAYVMPKTHGPESGARNRRPDRVSWALR